MVVAIIIVWLYCGCVNIITFEDTETAFAKFLSGPIGLFAEIWYAYLNSKNNDGDFR